MDRCSSAWRPKPRTVPAAWLSMAEIYGDVGRSPVFAEAFTRSLNAVWRSGTVAAVEAYLAGKPA